MSDHAPLPTRPARRLTPCAPFALGMTLTTHGAMEALRSEVSREWTPLPDDASEQLRDTLHRMTIYAANMAAGAFFRRHARGDWGDVCDHDHALNEAALQDGSRLMSVYTLTSGNKLWIITEADRSATTILTPEEY